MKYGCFDDERREYVITRPDTPVPWINYLGVNEYCGLISNTAGGYSFCRGVARATVEGKSLDVVGNEGVLLPLFGDGRAHDVEVELG